MKVTRVYKNQMVPFWPHLPSDLINSSESFLVVQTLELLHGGSLFTNLTAVQGHRKAWLPIVSTPTPSLHHAWKIFCDALCFLFWAILLDAGLSLLYLRATNFLSFMPLALLPFQPLLFIVKIGICVCLTQVGQVFQERLENLLKRLECPGDKTPYEKTA